MIRLGMILTMICAITSLAGAEEPPVKHRILFAEYGGPRNRLVELDKEGAITWEHVPPSLTVIFQPLPNGHVVYAYGGMPTGVAEVNREQKTVWNYVSKCPQVLGCQRLADGNTVVAEQGPPQAVEVDPKGQTVHTTPIKTSYEHFHQQVRNIEKLPNGNILAALEGEGAAREFDPSGRVVWEFNDAEHCVAATRLPNGNTLVACGTKKRLVEVTPDGEIVWEFGDKDAPELNLTWLSSVQVLKNGHYVVGNFLRGSEGKGAHAFEVTRDKKVVWTFADHKRFSSITTIRVIEE